MFVSLSPHQILGPSVANHQMADGSGRWMNGPEFLYFPIKIASPSPDEDMEHRQAQILTAVAAQKTEDVID